MTVLVATSVLLVACSSGDRLQALLDDPVAEYEAEGIELTRQWNQGDGVDLLGTPFYAEVIRVYRIIEQEPDENVLFDAVAFAENHGWEMGQSVVSPTKYQGTKELDSELARLTIGVGREQPGNVESERILQLTLDYGHLSDRATEESGE